HSRGAARVGDECRRCRQAQPDFEQRQADAAIGIRQDHRAAGATADHARRPVPGEHAQLRHRSGRLARSGGRRHPQGRARHRAAVDDHDELSRRIGRVRALARQRALADPRGGRVRLHRARRAVRKLRAPADDSVDAAVGGRGRAARADHHRQRPRRDQHHRHHPADRHRQEERDHDDRLRDRRRARAAVERARCDSPGCAVAPAADPDDNVRRAVCGGATDALLGCGRRAAPAARPRHLRRAHRQPDADAVHHPGDLPRVRPPGRRPHAPHRARRYRRAVRRLSGDACMNLSRPFVLRPIGTVLLTAGVALAGIGAFFVLPVASLPQIDLPVISVNASIPGASPETMASSVATPLERHLGTIPSVNEITSTSSVGATRVTLQFDLSRDIDGAARDVQAAINAARVDLPATLRANPTYRKVNPSAAPVMILALTSKTKTPGQIYDEASNILNQQLLQVSGVGDVQIGGGSLPAVRIELEPFALNQYGISTEDVRAAIQASNANRPKGIVQGNGRRQQIYTQTPGLRASDYTPMVVAWRNGAAVRLQDVATVVDGVEDTHTLGLYNGERAVIVLIRSQPAVNVIETVDSVRALLPALQAELPADVELHVASDRTHSIRASLHEVEVTLIVSVILVVLVVSAFLRSVRATLVPAVATVTALLGTFGVMYLLGFSLDNLSLMALTVATGFVVDDAIVVLENTSRHIEAGMARMQAALTGAREVGFTVVSISLSLVAVFIPLLFMAGLPGRLFREFAVTLSAAGLISLVVSLTTTPMMCAWVLRPGGTEAKRQGWLARQLERGYDWMLARYVSSLDW